MTPLTTETHGAAVPESYSFTCPDCGLVGGIDADQAAGGVSIVCPADGCEFHGYIDGRVA